MIFLILITHDVDILCWLICGAEVLILGVSKTSTEVKHNIKADS